MRNDKPSKRLFRAERREGLFRSNGDGSLREPFAWLSSARRLAKDYQRLPESHETFVELAMIRLLLRQLAKNDFSNRLLDKKKR